MIDQIAFFVRNIGIAVLPDPYIINIIGNVRKTDVNSSNSIPLTFLIVAVNMRKKKVPQYETRI